MAAAPDFIRKLFTLKAAAECRRWPDRRLKN
jgi:hypothetical protein